MTAQTTEARTYRGTSNTNVRGNTATRRRRREWLVNRFRADVDARVTFDADGTVMETTDRHDSPLPDGADVFGIFAACRCYRCGELLTVHTVTADRIVPGCEDGTYDLTNVRPCCQRCNSVTGGVLGAARKAGRR
jgi:hypothetical protein